MAVTRPGVASPQKRCENLKMWDQVCATLPTSPLHHDKACPIHGDNLSIQYGPYTGPRR